MNIEIWTDGSASPNPGPGGWGAILRTQVNGKLHEKEISGGKAHTTNNEMEMLAVEEALKAVKHKGCSIKLYTDSQLAAGYLRFGWKVKAAHLRPIVGRICEWVGLVGHDVEYIKVAGYNGVELNERADKLAKAAADSYHGE